MATIINSADVDSLDLDKTQKFHFYNAMDSCITREVLDKIKPELDGLTGATYEAARALQAPVLCMMRKGMLIDAKTRQELINKFSSERAVAIRHFKFLIDAYTDASIEFGYCTDAMKAYFKDFNYRSVEQVKTLFYKLLAMPEILSHEGRPTVDRHALERLERYPLAAPYAKLMMKLRDTDKVIQDASQEIDSDGRFRTTFNIVGTTTGRFSSYKSYMETGSNIQNKAPVLRKAFVADKGCKIAYIDLEQAEARGVGARVYNLFGDSKYLDAAESGDTHTAVAKMVWSHIKTKKDAEQKFYREFSYRFICKRVGFGTNLIGTPRTISQETSIPASVVEQFQELYFATFPGIRHWHHWAAEQLVSPGFIVSLMGRKRWFFGKPDDDAVVREAVGFDAQEPVAKILNIGLFRTWWKSHRGNGILPIDLLAQVHDAVILQYPEHLEDEILSEVLPLFQVALTLRNNRQFIIPSEAKVGWNWEEQDGDRPEANPDGLIKWRAGQPDKRTRSREPSMSILD